MLVVESLEAGRRQNNGIKAVRLITTRRHRFIIQFGKSSLQIASYGLEPEPWVFHFELSDASERARANDTTIWQIV